MDTRNYAEKSYSGNTFDYNLSNLSFDRLENNEMFEEKISKQTYEYILENARKLFYCVNDSRGFPGSHNFSLKDRIDQLSDAEIDNLASLLTTLADKVGESVELLFNYMNRIIEKMGNIFSEQEVKLQDMTLIEDSNNLIESITSINDSFIILENGIENEIKCLKSIVSFSSFMEPLKQYQKFYQDVYKDIQKKTLLCGQLIEKAEIRTSEDYYREHKPSINSTKLFSGATGMTPDKLNKVFKNYHKRSNKIALIPKKLKEAQALMETLEAGFRKKYNYWAYLCAERIHPDDSLLFSITTEQPFKFHHAIGYYSYIDHLLNFSQGGLFCLQSTDPAIIENGLASKYLKMELKEISIKTENTEQENSGEDNEKNFSLFQSQEDLAQISIIPHESEEIVEVKNKKVQQGYEKVIEIAREFLSRISAPKKPLDNQLFLLKERIGRLTNSEIDNLVHLLQALSVKLAQKNHVTVLNYTDIMCNSIRQLPSDQDIIIKDKILMENSNDLIKSMSTIKDLFTELRNGIINELERLKNVHFSDCQNPLMEYQKFYTEASSEIKNQLLLCEQLIKDTRERASEDYYRKHIPSTRSINLLSSSTGVTQTGLLKTLYSYHERSEEIALLPKKLLKARKLMELEVKEFRKKYCFLAYLYAEQIIPDDSWGFSGSKQFFYTQYKLGYFNYIDNTLIFPMHGVLARLNSEDPFICQGFLDDDERPFFSDSDQSPNEWMPTGSFSSDGLIENDAAKANQSTDSIKEV